MNMNCLDMTSRHLMRIKEIDAFMGNPCHTEFQVRQGNLDCQLKFDKHSDYTAIITDQTPSGPLKNHFFSLLSLVLVIPFEQNIQSTANTKI